MAALEVGMRAHSRHESVVVMFVYLSRPCTSACAQPCGCCWLAVQMYVSVVAAVQPPSLVSHPAGAPMCVRRPAHSTQHGTFNSGPPLSRRPLDGTPAVIWDALRAACDADVATARTILDSAGVIVAAPDMSVCYDEQGSK